MINDLRDFAYQGVRGILVFFSDLGYEAIFWASDEAFGYGHTLKLRWNDNQFFTAEVESKYKGYSLRLIKKRLYCSFKKDAETQRLNSYNFTFCVRRKAYTD